MDVDSAAFLLREAIQGRTSVKLQSECWDCTYAGDVSYRVGVHRVVVFIDCGDLDYVDSIYSPDETLAGDFDSWVGSKHDGKMWNPLWMLTYTEQDELRSLLRRTKAGCPGCST